MLEQPRVALERGLVERLTATLGRLREQVERRQRIGIAELELALALALGALAGEVRPLALGDASIGSAMASVTGSGVPARAARSRFGAFARLILTAPLRRRPSNPLLAKCGRSPWIANHSPPIPRAIVSASRSQCTIAPSATKARP